MGMNLDKPAKSRSFVTTESEDGRWLTIAHKGQVVMTLLAPLGDKLYLTIDMQRVSVGAEGAAPAIELLSLPEQPVEVTCPSL